MNHGSLNAVEITSLHLRDLIETNSSLMSSLLGCVRPAFHLVTRKANVCFSCDFAISPNTLESFVLSWKVERQRRDEANILLNHISLEVQNTTCICGPLARISHVAAVQFPGEKGREVKRG